MADVSSLEVRDLHVGYASRPVLREVSLAVTPGEVLVLLGPNGAGKTTLLRALARLLRPSRGAVLFDGTDLWHRPPRWAASRVAIAPQQQAIDWPLTVEEAVILGRSAQRGWLMPFSASDHDIVRAALQRTGLLELRERPIAELSSGEGQRVLLARALAQESKVLLFDEPTAHLDLRYQVEVMHLTRRLALDDNLAIVLTLHDLNQAALWGDRLALLTNGRLLMLGTPDQVLTAERIREAYGQAVSVLRHPVSGLPFVVPAIER
jgi:iron complex transport system ATP-binding protein